VTITISVETVFRSDVTVKIALRWVVVAKELFLGSLVPPLRVECRCNDLTNTLFRLWGSYS
jgi:hypothetical protein